MAFKFLFFLIPLPLLALPGFHEPWGTHADLHYPSPPTPPPSSFTLTVVAPIIRFHQQIISPVDGPRSHFRPSSSQYMLQAIQKHGLYGVFLGFDRLLRENSDEWVYRTITTPEGLIKYDPPP